MNKFKVLKHGWIIPTSTYSALGIWKSILAVKPEFEKWIRFCVCNGHLVNFSYEVCCSSLQLKQLFGVFYSLDKITVQMSMICSVSADIISVSVITIMLSYLLPLTNVAACISRYVTLSTDTIHIVDR